MTVFKGYLRIIKRNLPLMIMYFAIFMAVSIGTHLAVGENSAVSFEAKRLQVGIIDQDGGELAKGLIEYMAQMHDIVYLENDQSVIQEQLFYRNVSYVVTIPEDFAEKCLENGEKLSTTKIPDTFYAYYAEQRIDDFMNGVRVYKDSGFNLADAIELTVEQGLKEPKVDILDVNGNQGQVPGYMYMLKYYPYLFITVICFAVSFVMLVFRDKDIRRRMQSSAVSMVKQNIAAGAAMALLAIVLFILCLILPAILYSGSFLKDIHLGYLVLNIFVMMLSSLAMAFLVGVVAKNTQIVNNIVNALSLGMCFLGGVFVSLELLGDNVKKISQFLPTYWYENNLDLMSSYSTLSKAVKLDMYKGFGIQLAFAAACVSLALVISKYKVQEK